MNKKKCSVVHIKKEVQHTTGFKAGQMKIDFLEDGAHYKLYWTSMF